MSCEDLDRLRTASPHSNSSAWPRQAREHLKSCERCSRLQASLDTSAPGDLPDLLRQRIEAAILPGLGPVSPLPGVLRTTLTLLGCLAIVIAAQNWRLGVAGWRARNAFQLSVNLTLLGISVFALASLLAQRISPGYRRNASVWLYLAVPFLALLAADLSLFGYHWSADFVPRVLWCWEIGIECAALTAPLFWLVLRRGFPLDPVAHGATAGFLAGLAGVTVLELYCPNLDRLHISVAHLGAAVSSALMGAALGWIQKIIRRRISLGEA